MKQIVLSLGTLRQSGIESRSDRQNTLIFPLAGAQRKRICGRRYPSLLRMANANKTTWLETSVICGSFAGSYEPVSIPLPACTTATKAASSIPLIIALLRYLPRCIIGYRPGNYALKLLDATGISWIVVHSGQ
jgi:hypothetical protein